MKVHIRFGAISSCILLAVQAQLSAQTNTASSGKYQIAERGQDYAVWQRLSLTTNRNGSVSAQTNRYVELETGMHYREDGRWLRSREEIQIIENWAVATNGPHKVAFAANINSPISVEVRTPDKKRLRFRPLGLAYYDFAARTNGTVLIAELKDAIGELVATNQVVYPDAFTDFLADVRYTYKKSGLEQDIILRQRPPLPEEYGLNPASTRLLVLTEFLEGTNDVRTVRHLRHGWKKASVDKIVDFGAMKIGHGSAFNLGQGAGRLHDTPVQKHWTVLDGRTFLVEEVSFPKISAGLEDLQASAQSGPGAKGLLARHIPSTKLVLPPSQTASLSSGAQFQVASAPGNERGLVLDFDLESGIDVVLQGDTTYVVTGLVNLTNATIEGGTVVKYNRGASIQVYAAPNCLTGPYRPAIFTAIDDNTVGEHVGNGNPTGTYAARALSLHAGGDLKHLNIRYAKEAIYCGNNDYSVNHSQILSSDCGFHSETANFTNCNILMANVRTNFYGSYFHGRVEHLTADHANVLVADPNFAFLEDCEGKPSSSVTLVNTLTASLTNGYAVAPLCDAVFLDHAYGFASAQGVFQAVGAGAYYLVDGSTNRNVGTSDIQPDLVVALKQKTTYPPLVYSNITILTDTSFYPLAQRDTDIPDLGYHYDPLDYAFGGVEASANVTFGVGTAVGFFSTEQAGPSIHLADAKTLSFQGTAHAPDYWVRYCTVQEGGHGTWTQGYGAAGSILGSAQSNEDAPLVNLRFTRCSEMSYGSCFVRDYSGQIITHAQDCEFYNAGFGGWVVTVALTNCLLDRCSVVLNGGVAPNQITLQNCTMRGSVLSINRWEEDAGSPGTGLVPVTIVNSAFDGTSISTEDAQFENSALTYYDFNAFLLGANKTTPLGSNPKEVSDFNWQTSWLGDFYLPSDSPLKDAGNVSDAAQLGLYHYTSQTNFENGLQVKEGHTQVDIGYHYIAVDMNGNPIDTDGDGIPDYLEDANGDGQDAGDLTSWTMYDSPNGLSKGSGLQVFTPYK